MSPHETPDFWQNLRRELRTGRAWVDRAIVIAAAVATGGLVVGVTLLCEAASHAFERMRASGPLGPWLMLLWTPVLTVILLWLTRRFAPGAAGSGIPQVMVALDDTLPQERRRTLVSLSLALKKAALLGGTLLAGLSAGREGPTVQIGAGVMHSVRRWLSPAATIDAHDLMVAGAAAGIAAAFNTPLGGVMFALEKLSRRHHAAQSALVILCIVLSGLVAVSVFGNLTYFGQLGVAEVPLALLGPGFVVAVVAGLLGGLFSLLLVKSLAGGPTLVMRWRAAYPLRFAAACAFAVAVIGLVSGGTTAGAGYAPTRAMLEGDAQLPVLYTLLKFCATWLTTWTGVPAGVFAPSLAVGAGIGRDIALLFGVPPSQAIPLIALGMVGFLAAATQGPLTAFILVMEMVSGHAMVLSLMLTAFVSSGISRLICRPLYAELAGLMHPPAAAAHAGAAAAPLTSAPRP